MAEAKFVIKDEPGIKSIKIGDLIEKLDVEIPEDASVDMVELILIKAIFERVEKLEMAIDEIRAFILG